MASRAALQTLWRSLLLAAPLSALAPAGHAQSVGQPSIYVCVDANGRRITSDRPIPECADREQRELRPSGALKRTVPPTPTLQERAAEEARQREQAEREARIADEKRRERVLLTRYPNQAAHDRARADALQQIDETMASIRTVQSDLERQRKSINAELEFYAKDPARAPAWLKQRQADNAQQLATQELLLADQEREKTRIHARFDEELLRLQKLWDAAASAR